MRIPRIRGILIDLFVVFTSFLVAIWGTLVNARRHDLGAGFSYTGGSMHLVAGLVGFGAMFACMYRLYKYNNVPQEPNRA